MDVRLPSGQIVRNVPEGISKTDLRMKLLRAGINPDTPAPAVDPTEGMGGFEKARAGFGKAFVDLGRGTRQLFGIGDQAALQETIDRENELAAPLMGTGAGTAGNIAGNLAALFPAAMIPGVNTVAGGALLGAGSGALQPVASDEDRADNVILGGLAGGGGTLAAKAIGRMLRPVRQAASPRVTALANELRAMGGRVTPGQATGSPFLQGLEASMEAFPPTSGVIKGIKAQNTKALNARFAEAIGEKADELTDEVLGRAHARITGVFNRVATDTPVAVNGRNVLKTVTDLDAANRGVVTVTGNPLVQEVLELAGTGLASGRQLQHLSNRLRVAAEREMKSASGDRQLGIALYQVREAVDDELLGGLSDDAARAFQSAREQYRNLMTLTTNKNVVNEATGDVSAANLAAALRGKEGGAYLFGRDGSRSEATKGMYRAARVGKAFRDIVGNSGTATRQFIPYMLGTGAVGAAGGAMTGAPVEGGLTGASLPLVAALLARGYARPGFARYMQGGVPLPPALKAKALADALAAGSTIGPIAAVQSQ